MWQKYTHYVTWSIWFKLVGFVILTAAQRLYELFYAIHFYKQIMLFYLWQNLFYFKILISLTLSILCNRFIFIAGALIIDLLIKKLYIKSQWAREYVYPWYLSNIISQNCLYGEKTTLNYVTCLSCFLIIDYIENLFL